MNEDIKENEMYCPECGKLIDIDSRHCKYCGNKLVFPEDSEIINKPVIVDKRSDKKVICPVCGNTENSYKISAIYSSGISRSSYSGSATSFITPMSSKESSSVAFTPIRMSGINISELSEKLAPPSTPRKKSSGCLFAFLIYLLIGLIPWGIVMPYIFLSEEDKIISLIIIPPIISFTISFFIIRFIIKRRRYLNLSYEKEIENYKKLMPRWEKLYYCFKDDVVFDPKTLESYPIEGIGNLLFKKEK